MLFLHSVLCSKRLIMFFLSPEDHAQGCPTRLAIPIKHLSAGHFPPALRGPEATPPPLSARWARWAQVQCPFSIPAWWGLCSCTCFVIPLIVRDEVDHFLKFISHWLGSPELANKNTNIRSPKL